MRRAGQAASEPGNGSRAPVLRRAAIPFVAGAALLTGTWLVWGRGGPAPGTDAPAEVVQQDIAKDIEDELAPIRHWLVHDPHIRLDPGEAAALVLGEGFALYELDSGAVRRGVQPGARLAVDAVVKRAPGNAYLFPLLAGGRTVAQIEVERRGGEWTIFEAGTNGPESEWDLAAAVRAAREVLARRGLTGDVRLVYDRPHAVTGLIGSDGERALFVPLRDHSFYNLREGEPVGLDRLIEEVARVERERAAAAQQ